MAMVFIGFAVEAALEWGFLGETAATLTSGVVEAGALTGEAVGTVEVAATAGLTDAAGATTAEGLGVIGTRTIQGRVAARGAIASGITTMGYKGKNAVKGIMIGPDGEALAHGDVHPDDIGNEYSGSDGKRRKIDFEHTFEDSNKHSLGLDVPLPPTKRRKGERTPHKIVSIEQYNDLQHKKNPFFTPLVDQTNMSSMRKNNGIPHTRTVIHRFSTNEGSNTQTADDNTVAFSVTANSIENPSASGAITSNAMLFDQMAQVYERYTVLKAVIRVDYFNDSTSEGKVVGISLKDDTTTLTDTGHYAELGDTIYKTLTPKEHSQIVMTANPAKYFGVKKSGIMADDRLSCATGSDARPSDALFFHVWAAPINGANSATGSVQHYMTVEYTVKWQQPIDTARSTA